MSTSHEARARLAALGQQVDDAEDAERKVAQAVAAALAAKEATETVATHVYGAIAGVSPGIASAPLVPAAQTSTQMPAPVEEIAPVQAAERVMVQPTEQLMTQGSRRPVPEVARNWSKRAWVMAILGGLIAFMVTMSSRAWFANLADVEGTADWLFRFGWVGLGSAAGFFAGGWYGALSFPNHARYYEEES